MRDILLRFHHAGLFQARWTERILDEWTRSLLDWKPHLERSIRSQRRAMAEHFDDALVIRHEPLVGVLDLPDPDDRQVLAAAIRCSARYIITDNLADFPEEVLAGFDIEAIAADAFLSQIAELHPSEALAVLSGLRAQYRNHALHAVRIRSRSECEGTAAARGACGNTPKASLMRQS